MDKVVGFVTRDISPNKTLLGPLLSVWDAQGRLLQANNAVRAVFAAEAGDPTGKTLEELFPVEGANMRARLDRVLATGQSESAEVDFDLNGQSGRGLITAEPGVLEDGTRILAHLFVDITAHHQREMQLLSTVSRQKAELQASQQALNGFFNLPGTYKAYYDRTGQLLACNKEYESLLPPGLAPWIGLPVEQLFGPEGGAVIRQRIDRVLESHEGETFEGKYGVAGGIRWYNTLYQPGPLVPGGPEGVFIRANDVTEVRTATETALETLEVEVESRTQTLAQKVGELEQSNLKLLETTRALGQSESLIRTIFEKVNEAFIFTGPDRRIQILNPAFERLLGYSASEVLGRTTKDFYHDPSQYERDFVYFHRDTTSDYPSFEVEFRRRDGSTFWATASKTDIRDDRGDILGYFGIIRDVTQQRASIQSLLASEEQYRFLAENSTEAIWILDVESRRMRYVSPAVLKQRGFTVEEVLAETAEERFTPDSLAESDQKLRARIELWKQGARDTVYTDEVTQPRKDGTVVHIEALTRFFSDPATGRLMILGVSRDIGERKKLWGQLIEAQKFETLGTLAAGIAHDFNNLLSIIQGSAELLSLGSPDASLTEKRLTSIRSATKRGSDLVRQLLLFARRIPASFTPVQIDLVIMEVAAVLRETFPGLITVQTEIAEKLPSILADSSQLHQILMNLCVNARDAMPQGGLLKIGARVVLATELRAAARKAGDRFVRIEVQDSGQGMDAEVLKKVFEPFFTTKALGKGTGLGLSVVFGIVEAHGGWVEVDSQPGRGSTFHCYLPIPSVRSRSHPERLARSTRSGNLNDRGTILLVEDEDELGRIVEFKLRSSGFEVITASDGAEGWDVFQRNQARINLVITDLEMPNSGGAELARCLEAEAPTIPVIITTGLLDHEGLNSLGTSARNSMLEKPYQLEDLVALIRSRLRSPAGS